jgi:outer membrane protein assembly factor BamB
MVRGIYFCFVVLAVMSTVKVSLGEDWPRFLGPNGSGIGSGSDVTTEWSSDKNLKWKIELPGRGSSCPIVIGEHVYITCYHGYGMSPESPGKASELVRSMICVDRKTGTIVWNTPVPSTVDEDPYEGFIVEHGYSSSTPTTDGKHLFALFGKSGAIAFDMKGNIVWKKSLGTMSDPAKWGDGSSPVVYKDLVIFNAGILGNQIVALNSSTGDEVWKIEDPKFTNAWSTPILVTVDGHDELVFSMPEQIIAMDPLTGEKLWNAISPIKNTVCPSLACLDGVVFAMGGRNGAAIAYRCGGKGDVSETHKVWEAPLKAGICTPIVADGHLIWASSGVLTCVDCATGKQAYQERLKAASVDASVRRPAGDYASPIVVGDKVVLVSRSGVTYIVKSGAKFEKVGGGSFAGDEGPFNATPAYSNGDLFIRSNKMLYCIGAN